MTDTQDDQPYLPSYWRAPLTRRPEDYGLVIVERADLLDLLDELALWKDRAEAADQALAATLKAIDREEREP